MLLNCDEHKNEIVVVYSSPQTCPLCDAEGQIEDLLGEIEDLKIEIEDSKEN